MKRKKTSAEKKPSGKRVCETCGQPLNYKKKLLLFGALRMAAGNAAGGVMRGRERIRRHRRRIRRLYKVLDVIGRLL